MNRLQNSHHIAPNLRNILNDFVVDLADSLDCIGNQLQKEGEDGNKKLQGLETVVFGGTVFELFMHKKQPVDRHLLDCLNTLGDHTGQFFKRKEYEKVHIKMKLGSCKTDIMGIWHPFVCLFARDSLYQRMIKAGCKGSPEYYYNGVHGGSRPVLYFQHPRQRSSV